MIRQEFKHKTWKLTSREVFIFTRRAAAPGVGLIIHLKSRAAACYLASHLPNVGCRFFTVFCCIFHLTFKPVVPELGFNTLCVCAHRGKKKSYWATLYYSAVNGSKMFIIIASRHRPSEVAAPFAPAAKLSRN